MAFEYAQSTQPAQPSSLIADGMRLNERLVEIHARVAKLADALHGPSPRDTGPSVPQTVEPAAHVRRNLDRSHSMLIDIENELSRIEGRL